MIVAVGTKNPAKLEGVARGFAKYYPAVELRPIDSSSVARAQPSGLEEMTGGAIARARFALARTRADFGVGVESGIFSIEGVYFVNQVAAVVDASGRASLGHSAGYSLPKEQVEQLFIQGKELERWAEKVTGIVEVGDKGGLIHHLTNGKISRADLTEQCVMTALIPRLHPDIYGF